VRVRVLIIERNLIWSARLSNSVRLLGHEVVVAGSLPDELAFDVAILNLAEPDPRAVGPLQAAGVKIIAHAGHKEKDRLELGRAAGCDLVVTNSELTYKLPEILDKLGLG
jgi:hypothetical protein